MSLRLAVIGAGMPGVREARLLADHDQRATLWRNPVVVADAPPPNAGKAIESLTPYPP
jgi:hypothetical protein